MAISLSPVPLSTRSESCYVALRAAILNLDIAPGTPLDEGHVAAQLGVSKTPLREAISRLTGEGLIIARPASTKYVADLPMETIRELYQMRIILESATIRLATDLLTEQDLVQMEGLIDEAEAIRYSANPSPEDLVRFIATNEEFHGLPFQRIGNSYLMNVATNLFERIHRVRAALYRIEQGGMHGDLTHAPTHKGLGNHRAVLDALFDRDADRASKLVREGLQAFLVSIDTPELEAALQELSYRP